MYSVEKTFGFSAVIVWGDLIDFFGAHIGWNHGNWVRLDAL